MQEQLARRLTLWQLVFAPQGLGSHGSTGDGSTGLTTSGILLHCLNGSPLNPFGHLHTAKWFLTVHLALRPQAPVQGSTQRCCEQACFLLHSLLIMHSGRQLGGAPMFPLVQEHIGRSPNRLHTELGPQGLGTQGSFGREGGSILGGIFWQS